LVRPSNSQASSKSSVFIAIAVTIAMLYFGRQIFIPLALALVISFLLSPIVDLLERIHLGRVPSVITVLALCFVLAAGVGWAIAGQILDITGHLGDYKENLEQTIHSLHPPSTINQATATVRELNNELEAAPGKVSNSSPDSKAHPAKPVTVQVTAPPTNLLQDIRALLGPLAGPLETAGIVIIFTAFMLMKREDLRNRLIRLGGRGQLTVVTQALDDASHRLSRYLLLQFLVNAAYGGLFGLAVYFIGVPHALLWGALAALLRLVPYIGTPIATVFPVAMALAVFPGWKHAALIIGVFLVLEVIVGNFIEPWLYGAHTGISSIAILVAAVFWSVLWGPVGLILSTPLTVCLMLVGRYVPHLSFLEVLLGDEPVLSPPQLFYQRLLAMDSDEAREVAETEMRDQSLESLYETVLIPALGLAEEDRHTGAVTERTTEFVYQSTREVIDDLGERPVSEDDHGQSIALRKDSPVEILCVPARDEADELVGMMFSQLLAQAGYSASHLAIGTVEDMLRQAGDSGCTIVCISALPPAAVGQARSLCKRLHARFPDLSLVIGLWRFSGGVPKAQERVGAGCTDAVATTLSEALLQIRRLSEICEPSPSAEVRS
jgi:predicted PurR-regulated permease PerM